MDIEQQSQAFLHPIPIYPILKTVDCLKPMFVRSARKHGLNGVIQRDGLLPGACNSRWQSPIFFFICLLPQLALTLLLEERTHFLKKKLLLVIEYIFKHSTC